MNIKSDANIGKHENYQMEQQEAEARKKNFTSTKAFGKSRKGALKNSVS